MPKKKTIVLEHERISFILKRFAHRIVEDHHGEKKIVLIGVLDNGFRLAEEIKEHLQSISKQKIELMSLKMDKLHPLESPIEFDSDPKTMNESVVILVDDVLNSGRTLVHGLAEILKYNARIVNTYVLVDRIHRDYPVKADHVGMTLSTTLQERVEVHFSKKETYAYLT